MSANNWTYCPRCCKAAEDKINAAEVNLTKIYGEVPAETYMKAVSELVKLREVGLEDVGETLREDYTIGITDDEFFVHYKGICDHCGLIFNFEHTVDQITKRNK